MAFKHPGKMHPNNIIVVNRTTHKTTSSDVYVGRPSVLGNPYAMTSDTDIERKRVIEDFRGWLRQRYLTQHQPTMNALTNLVWKYKRGEIFHLVCYCSPKACHADIIKDAIIKLAERSVASEKGVQEEST